MAPHTPSPHQIRSLFHSLRNTTWKLERRITGKPMDCHLYGEAGFYETMMMAGGKEGNSLGTASSSLQHTSNNNTLYYHEQGLLQLGNLSTQKSKVFQRYTYQWDPETEAMTVYFDDGRLFYVMKWDNNDNTEKKEESSRRHIWRATGSHLCGKDQYEAEYLFQVFEEEEPFRMDSFQLTYRVNGPEKDYVSTSWFKRVEEE